MAVSQPRARTRSRTRREGREGPAFMDDLLAMAGSLASSRREYASAQLEDLADSFRQLSDTLPSLPTVKTYAESAADSLEDLASYVLETDVPEIVADARELARRHPLVTFGGSIVAGLVLTQLVQSRTQAMRGAVRASRRRASSRRRGESDVGEPDDAAA